MSRYISVTISRAPGAHVIESVAIAGLSTTWMAITMKFAPIRLYLQTIRVVFAQHLPLHHLLLLLRVIFYFFFFLFQGEGRPS